MKIAAGVKIDRTKPTIEEQYRTIFVLNDTEILTPEQFLEWMNGILDSTNDLLGEIHKNGCFYKHPGIQRAILNLNGASERHGGKPNSST